jgi:hypothetical protein
MGVKWIGWKKFKIYRLIVIIKIYKYDLTGYIYGLMPTGMKEIGKIIMIVLLWIIYVVGLTSQQPIRSCGAEVWVDQRMDKDPEYRQYYQNSFRSFYQKEASRTTSPSDCPYVIPVHVIILHQPGEAIGEGSNISVEHIQSQIDVLNEDFGRYNADASNTPAQFAADDTRIQFCLAKFDENGDPTSGITRYATNEVYDFGDDSNTFNTRTGIKAQTGWDHNKYLNIWVAPTIGSDSDIIGFARVPTLFGISRADDDGVSILTSVFGGPGYGSLSPYHLGRTTTHEVGHYFGLNHIANKDNTCSQGDGIDDTPMQFKQNYGCPSHPNISCGNDGDMFMNYMDYTDDACMNAFTSDQGTYMRAIIEAVRSGLLTQAAIACPDEVSIEIEVLAQGQTSCHDAIDGYIHIDACSGNNNNYTYQIDNGFLQPSGDFTGLGVGNHTITITNDIGISRDTTIEISGPDKINISAIDIHHISCYGANDGGFSLELSGGSTDVDNPYSISINGGPFTSTLTYNTLGPGSYSVRVRDKNDCEATTSVNLNTPDQLSIGVTGLSPVSCNGGTDGSITVNGLGGLAGYTYSLNGIIYEEPSTFNNLSSGSITLWVRDANNCVALDSFTITEPELLEIAVTQTQEISCAGINDAAITIAADGGSAGYTYILDGEVKGSNVITGLGSGAYTAMVMDQNQCQASIIISIEDPSPLMIDAVKTRDVMCAGDMSGSIEVTASGGSMPYSYFLDGVQDSDGIFENLNENLYEISVTDAHHCEIVSETVLITNGNLKVIQDGKKIPTCSYSTDGAIIVSATGGEGDYTYSIDGINFKDSNEFLDLPSGIYNVRVSDGEDCLASTIVDLRAPRPVGLKSLDVMPPSCHGATDGIIDFEITGGSGNYEYKLNGNLIESDFVQNLKSGDYILEVKDGKSCRFETLISLPGPERITLSLGEIIPADCSQDRKGSVQVYAKGGSGQLTYNINDIVNQTGQWTGLHGGKYLLMVSDESGCYETMEIEVPSIGGLTVDIDNLRNESCTDAADGSASLLVTGGQAPYQFTIEDQNYDNGEFNNLKPGVYSIYVSDQSTCVENTYFEILPATPIQLDDVGGTPPSCSSSSDGTLRLKASGGQGNLNFRFEGRDNSTGVFLGVAKGNYTTTISDENGCVSVQEITFKGPDKLRADDVEILSPSCFGLNDGSIYVKGGGGTGQKTILYGGNAYTGEAHLENLVAGNYRINLRDANNCTGRIDIFVDEPKILTITDTIITPQNYKNKGSLKLIVQGGKKPYSYRINGTSSTAQSEFSDLDQGFYQVTITDANGCTLDAEIEVPYDDSYENPPGSISEVLIGFERIKNETILSFIAHGDQKIRLVIFDAGGRYLMSTEEFSISGRNKMSIPARNFPQGIYIVRIDAERESEYHKFLKL